MCTPPTNYTHTLIQENLGLLFTLASFKILKMVIIRDIVSDFSDKDDIELIDDEEEEDDVEIGSSELHINIAYANPSGFFTHINSEVGRDYRTGSNTLRNDNDLFVWMQFESKESTLDVIKQFYIRNSFDYIVVESRPYRYIGRCTHYGAGCEWRIRASFNVKRGVWEIRKINGTHICLSTVVSQDHTKLNSAFISNCIINLVSEDPDIPIKVIVKEIVSCFGYTITYKKAWTAKQLAMSQIYGDWEGSYNDLSRWMNAVQIFSPGTVVRYEASSLPSMFATTSNTPMSACGSQDFYRTVMPSQVEQGNIFGNEINEGDDDEEKKQQLQTRGSGRTTQIPQQQLRVLPPRRRRPPTCGTSSHNRGH
ncbi:hypothetical protein Lal_00034128 [Lupinus albus]|nr:hypothetical protein Lal_00034128 [Lupinus albus]